MREIEPDHFTDFKAQILMVTKTLRIVGLWPSTEAFFSWNLYSAYTVFGILTCNVHYFVQVAYWFLVPSDLETISLSATVTFEQILTNVKVYAIVANFKTLKEIMKICNKRIFQPKNLKQQTTALTTLKQFKYFFIFFNVSATIAVCFWCLYPLVSYKNQPTLPYLAWYPFNETQYFKFVYLHQASSQFFIAQTHVNVDGFSMCLMALIIIQCDLLSDSVKNITRRTAFGLDEIQGMDILLRNSLLHYKEILSYFDGVYNMLNVTIFAQYISSAVSIGLALLQSTLLEPSDPRFFIVGMYLVAILGQLFMYCWWGNEVMNRSGELPYAAFRSNWIEASRKFKQNLLFFIHRAQTPLTVYAVDYFEVSLESFMMILRHSYSFYAVIRHMNTPKN